MAKMIVVGAGRSGLTASTRLAGEGRDVVLLESRPAPDPAMVAALGRIGVPAVWGPHPLALLEDCDGLVLSPGVPLSSSFVQEALSRGLSVIGELELAHRILRARNDGSMLLAVTGTNGKSTTTDLTAYLLQRGGLPSSACGNLGTPLGEAMETATPGTRYALECSSYQLETIATFHAEAAVLLNLTPDHLARHKTMSAYLAAKLRIFERQTSDDLRILPATGLDLEGAVPGHGRTVHFGWSDPTRPGAWCDSQGTLWLVDGEGNTTKLLHRSELRIPGDHNVENALAAAILAHHGGVSLEAVREGLRDYPGLAHRIAFCGERDGVKVYNDSKGTNVDATLTAIRALPGPLVLLLGGEDKGSSYAPLREALQGKLRHLVFLGDAIPQLERDLADLPHTSIKPFDDAVHAALDMAHPGDQVLLSPACASFDQFKNFEHRGEHFEQQVRQWAEKTPSL